jgi:hypothetical protein
MLAHLFHQTDSLGHLHGKVDGIDKRVSKLERPQRSQGSNPMWALITALIPGIPGALVLALAALGKLPWSAAMSALTGSSGH